MKGREGGQADRAEGRRGRGTGRAGAAGDPRGPVEAVGLSGSQVRRVPAGERWELGLAMWGSMGRARPRAQSGGLPKAVGETQ